jgi:hypothetical protein
MTSTPIQPKFLDFDKDVVSQRSLKVFLYGMFLIQLINCLIYITSLILAQQAIRSYNWRWTISNISAHD